MCESGGENEGLGVWEWDVGAWGLGRECGGRFVGSGRVGVGVVEGR